MLRSVLQKKTVAWSVAGVAVVALAITGVLLAMPSVDRTAAPRPTTTTTTTTTAYTTESVGPHPNPDAMTMGNTIVDAIARVDNAAIQSNLCSGATAEAKVPLNYPPGGQLVGAVQTRAAELTLTVKVRPRLDVIAVVQEQHEDDWCLIDLTGCPLTETGDYDIRTVIESGGDLAISECRDRPLRIE